VGQPPLWLAGFKLVLVVISFFDTGGKTFKTQAETPHAGTLSFLTVVQEVIRLVPR